LTVGVIGFGRIGRGVAERLSGFGCRVIASDPYLPDAAIAAAGAEPVTPAELAAQADVITLHAPGEQRIVDTQWLSVVRPGLILINTARADLVDETALADALRDRRVGSYAADTLSIESTGTDSPETDPNPLLAADLADRVTLTPHSAAQTVEAVDRMGAGASEAVRAVLQEREPDPALVGVVVPRAMLPV
jgi:D-3-phosphoglycerate dehydrogenase